MDFLAKWCSKCAELQLLIAYSPDKRASDGLQSSCKTCMQGWHATHTEHEKAYKQAHAEQRRLTDARSRIKHRDKRNAATRAWRSANPEKTLLAVTRWKQEHPEEAARIHRNAQSRRRARKKSGPVVETVDLDVLYARDKGRCGLCHKHVKRTDASRDHVIPLVEGGAHSYANCVLAHIDCNRKKGIKRVPQQQRLFG
jgi:5-methylcytosine-specific restriction endonuclease McrA